MTTLTQTLTQAFPFSFDKFPLSGPDGMRTGHYGLFRSDNAENIGNAVRSSYQPHTLDDVSVLAEAAMTAFDEGSNTPQINCHWRDGHHVTIAPSNDHRQSIFGTQDNIFPRFIVSAGYGGTAFSASLGLYRDCCRNLAMLQTAGERVSVKIRHTHSLRPRIAELVATFQGLASKWQGIATTARRMDLSKIDLAHFIRAVYPVDESIRGRSRTIADRRAGAIAQRIYGERRATGRPLGDMRIATAWEAFNGVQGYVQHDAPRKVRPSEAERSISALGDASVQRAMQLALELAS